MICSTEGETRKGGRKKKPPGDIDDLQKALKKKDAEISILSRILDRSINNTSNHGLPYILLHCLVDIVKADAGVIFLKAGSTFKPIAYSGIDECSREEYANNSGHSLLRRVIRESKSVFIEDALANTGLNVKFFAGRRIQSVFGMPVKHGNDLLGVIQLEWLETHTIVKRDFKLLEIAAGHYASALCRALESGRDDPSLIMGQFAGQAAGMPSPDDMVTDVNLRNKIQEELLISQSTFAIAQKMAHMGSWYWDLETDDLHWSGETYKIFGELPYRYNPSYQGFINAIVPEDRDSVNNAFREALADKKLFQIDFHIVLPDGTVRFISSQGGVVYDHHHKPICMTGVCLDITDRKLVDEALARSKAQLAKAQEIACIGDWDWDLITNEMEWSDETFRIYGYNPEAFKPVYEHVISRVHPRDRDLMKDAVRVALTGNKRLSIDYRIVLPDGSIRYCHNESDMPVRDLGGNPVRWMGTVQDITRRKKLEELLSISHKRFKVLVNSNTIGIIIADLDGIVEANDVFLNTIGYTRADMQGGKIDWRKMTSEEYRHSDNEGLGELLAHGSCAPYEKEYLRKDGSRVPVLIGSALLEKTPLTWVSYVLDITGRKKAEAEREELLKQLERSNQDLSAILEITSSAISTLEFEELIDTILKRLVNTMKCNAAVILLRDENVVRAYACTGVEKEVQDHYSTTIGTGFAGTIARSGQPLYIRDAQVDPTTNSPYVMGAGIRSMLGVPMEHNGDLIGVLHIDWLHDHPLDERELRILKVSAQRCAVAIANARLHKQTIELKHKVEVYLDLMSHGINNLNQIALGNLEMADEVIKDEEVRELIEISLDSIHNSAQLIDDVRELQQEKNSPADKEAKS